MTHSPSLVLVLVSVAQSANILGFGLFSSISHQTVFQPVWEELSKRGHKVTVITPNPVNKPELINLTEINTSFLADVYKTFRVEKMFSKEASQRQKVQGAWYVTNLMSEAILNNTKIQKFLNENHHFDVVIVEYYSPIFYALGHKYQAPVIGWSPMGAYFRLHDIAGNPSHPVLFPQYDIRVTNRQLSFGQRIDSTFYSIWYRIFYHYDYLPSAHEIAKRYFGDDIPYVGDLEEKSSLFFINENFLLYPPRPTVPTVISLEQMHIKPLRPLQKDLKELLDGAIEGVIYFSLGSTVHSVNISPKLRSTIIKALMELPYKIFWKWESDNLPEKPANVITRKWWPQQDLLAHKNIKAFLTQGGLQSTEEAISRGVPLIVMPFMGDQPMNSQKIVELGIGVQVDPEAVTKEELKNAILEVAENQKYLLKIKEIQDIMNDRPMTSLERAIWWIEYVIRHRGTKYLRSPMADVPYYQYFLIDVVTVTVLLPLVVIYLLVKLSVKLFIRQNQK